MILEKATSLYQYKLYYRRHPPENGHYDHISAFIEKISKLTVAKNKEVI